MPPRTRWVPGRWALLLPTSLAVGLAIPAQAQQSAPPAPASGAGPGVSLDRLLELPRGRRYEVDKRGGSTQSEWRKRFRSVREKLEAEREALEKAESELEEIAQSTEPWQLGPPLPGVTTADAPLDYRLRQEIKRHRREVERLEERLTGLGVEADLAGVPEDWRQ